MSDFHLSVGEQVTFSKTVGESDVYLFAGITGDLNGLHVNEQFMSGTAYGRRIAHGALLVGFMSTTSTMMIARCDDKGGDETPVSLGYDRIRFTAPVYINDTVSVTYTVAEIDEEVDENMDEAVAFAENSPWPDTSETYLDVFAGSASGGA